MDPLSDVLQLVSAKSFITTGQIAGSSWAMQYPGFDGMKFMEMRKGKLWFRLADEQEWCRLSEGDCVILTRSASFVMATDPSVPPVDSLTVPYTRKNGLAEYGGQENIIFAGKMEIDESSAGHLLDVLPTVIMVKTGSESSSSINWLMARLHEESQTIRPGASLAASHLMQLVMIESIRSWILSDASEAGGWLGALRDPRIFRSMAAMHAEPQKNWQLNELAGLAGMSRAGFSRRFTISTGTSPLSYLAIWRMRLASKALRISSEPIKHIAYRLGYASESTFSTVFRRIYGESPSYHRAQGHKGPLLSLGPFRSKTNY